jgi:hypothetical protein
MRSRGDKEVDECLRYMRAALKEGRRALPACLPNPPVGCVLVKRDQIVASGFTQPPGRQHAEAMALDQVSGDLSDVHAYARTMFFLRSNSFVRHGDCRSWNQAGIRCHTRPRPAQLRRGNTTAAVSRHNCRSWSPGARSARRPRAVFGKRSGPKQFEATIATISSCICWSGGNLSARRDRAKPVAACRVGSSRGEMPH